MQWLDGQAQSRASFLCSVIATMARDAMPLDPGRWGPAPDADEVRAAAAVNAVRLARERAGVAADALSREDVAELLGISSP